MAGSDNPSGAGNQQERPKSFRDDLGILRDYTPSTSVDSRSSDLFRSTCFDSLESGKRFGNTWDEDIVRATWRHVEVSRNDWPASLLGAATCGSDTTRKKRVRHVSDRSRKKVVTKLSEVPCRVSSDLHERRNDWSTVSTTDPVKL